MDELDEMLAAVGDKPEIPETPNVATEVVAEVTTEAVATEPVATETSDEVVAWMKEQGFTGNTRDDFKANLEKAKTFDAEVNKYKPFEAENATLKQREIDLAEKLTILKDHANPMTFFGSEDEYKAAILKKERPELDSATLMQVITKDTTKLLPLEVLKLQMKLNDPEFNNAEIEAYLADKYGIDFDTDFSELEILSQTKIKKDAKEALKEFTTLKEGVKVPEVIDVDTLLGTKKVQTQESLAKLQNDWEPLVKSIPEQLDKVVITEGGKTIFEFNIEDGFRKEISENIGDTKSWLISQGIEPTAENCKATIDNLKEYYFTQNRAKIMNAYASQKVTESELKLKAEFNNPTGANLQTANRTTPQQLSEADDDRNVMAAIHGL